MLLSLSLSLLTRLAAISTALCLRRQNSVYKNSIRWHPDEIKVKDRELEKRERGGGECRRKEGGEGVRLKSHLSDDRKCSTLEKRGGRKFVVSRSPFSNKRCFLLSSCIEQTTREWRISKKNQRIRRRISRRSRFSSRMLKVQTSRIVLADVVRIEIKKSSNSIRKECKKYRSSSRFFSFCSIFYPLSFFILFFFVLPLSY